jgi:3-oxoacyl-[acyl-carrier-protein] synthase-3
MVLARIVDASYYLPERQVSNHELPESLDTTDEWIVKRTGIQSRHLLSDSETASSMAILACQRLLAKCDINPDHVDSIIVATSTAHTAMPSTACQIANQLGIDQAFALDVNAACSGFLYALSLGKDRICTHADRYCLVVGVDAMSRILDWSDRSTAVLFGDGAGCVLLESSPDKGLLAIRCGSESRGEQLLHVSGNLHTSEPSTLSMHGKEVFKFAVERLYTCARDLMQRHNIPSDSIDWVVPHQANIRILDQVSRQIGISPDRIVKTLDQHANTSAASIPLALHTLLQSGNLKRGQRILFNAFGSGFTWGAAVCDF